jgi:predicted phage tail protein
MNLATTQFKFPTFMTKIFLHGIVGKKFGKCFNVNISNVFSALKAVECNREGFFKEIKDLSKKGFDYFMLVDGQVVETNEELIERRKIKEIHLIPAVHGSGAAIAVGIGLTGVTAQIVGFVIQMAVSAAVSLGVGFLMAQLNKQAQPPQQHIAVGGAAAAVEAAGKSYIFSNLQNLASQGDSIPVGYGRYKIGSHVVEISIKNYSTNQTYANEFSNYASISAFNDFLT